MHELISRVVGSVLTEGQRWHARQRIRRVTRPAWFGTLRRTSPLSESWGLDRGTPVDRVFIERFLNDCRNDIHGTVMEIRDSTYTDRFGVAVERAEILDIDAGNPHATYVADVASADVVPSDSLDCFILTQTLHYVYDMTAALRQIRRMLRPGGVLLATVPSIIRVERSMASTDHWRLTQASASRLFGEVFGSERVTVRAYGNPLTAVAFLMGVAAEELSPTELDTSHEHFPVVVAVRAVKAAG
ncbi:MAG: methyltransferase domain-containing protein [Chloroflexota bacterium]